jgi:hypothetical protein
VAKDRKLIELITRNPLNVRFDEICKLAQDFGFVLKGGRGSHRIYTRRGVAEMLNFQNVNGNAKPYQVRQLLRIIKKYNLDEGA